MPNDCHLPLSVSYLLIAAAIAKPSDLAQHTIAQIPKEKIFIMNWLFLSFNAGFKSRHRGVILETSLFAPTTILFTECFKK